LRASLTFKPVEEAPRVAKAAPTRVESLPEPVH